MANEFMTAATEWAVAVPEVWSKSFFPVLLAALPFNDLVARDYQGDISALGDTVNVTQVPEFDEGQEFGETEAVEADSVTLTQIQLVINKRVAKDFIITQTAQIQSIDAQMELRNKAFYAIMKKMQRTIIETIVPSASSPDHTIAYTSGTTLALADILAVKRLLDAQSVPDLDRSAVMGTSQANDMFNITGFTSRDYVPGADVMSSGQFPTKVLGFLPHMTTVVGNTSYWFHRRFMQAAVQKVPSVSVYDQGGTGVRAVRVNTDMLWGLKQFDNKAVVTLS